MHKSIAIQALSYPNFGAPGYRQVYSTGTFFLRWFRYDGVLLGPCLWFTKSSIALDHLTS